MSWSCAHNVLEAVSEASVGLHNYSIVILGCGGRVSAVGVAIHYWLDGPGIKFRCGTRFSAPVQTGPGAHPASYTVGTGSFPGVKWPGRSVDRPPPSSAEVEGRVELYIYSPSGPPWPVLGRTLIFGCCRMTQCRRRSGTGKCTRSATVQKYCSSL